MKDINIPKPQRPNPSMAGLQKAWKRYITNLEQYADLQKGKADGYREIISELLENAGIFGGING